MLKEKYHIIDYDNLIEGNIYHSTMNITESFAKLYCESIDFEYQPENLPLSIFAIYKPVFDALGGRVAQGTVHLKQKIHHSGIPCVGDSYKVEVKIIEKSIKKGKNYLVWEVLFLRDDILLCKQETANLWAYSKTN
jgi:hypothetical protein